MDFKILCQVGCEGNLLPYVIEFSNIWFQKLYFFFLFLVEFSYFIENLNVICHAKLNLEVRF